MPTKQTPKSCSCSACRRGKGTKGGKHMMKLSERAFRHVMKVTLVRGGDQYFIASKGGYFD